MALLNSFTSGVSAVKTFGKSLEVIGDNIANVNTTGFKGSRTTNKDSFNFTLERSTGGTAGAAGTSSPSAMQVGSGVAIASIAQQFTQGVLSTTGGPTDLGIAGKGFFNIRDGANNANTLYSRAGDFQIDNSGFLVTSQGYNVLGLDNTSYNQIPTTQTITLASIKIPQTATAAMYGGTAAVAAVAADPTATPPVPAVLGVSEIITAGKIGSVAPATFPQLQSYSIGNDGKILAYYAGAKNPVEVGQIILSSFKNPNALEKVGGNLLKSPGEAAGIQTPKTAEEATQYGEIKQGTLELSNVDLTQQFSDLILAQRAFQAGSRIITVSDSVMEEIVNLKR